jgi:mannan endo-1,4-beta-mannosidase
MTAMRLSRSSALVAGLAVLFAACTSSAPPPKPKATGFVRADGTRLVVDGKPYRFHGLNYYDMNAPGKLNPYHAGFETLRGCRNHSEVPNLDESLATIGPAANALRSWFFQPYAVSVPEGGGPSQRDWSVFDKTLAAVKRAHMKIVVTLTENGGTCDEPDKVRKTIAWYRTGYKTEIAPGLVATYRSYVQEIVTRYKDHSEILMWQLVNEPSAIGRDGRCIEARAARTLRAFADDVGGLIKSIDPNHLVSLGSWEVGCGLQGKDRRDFALVNESPAIDICEHHDYGQPTVPLPSALRQELILCAQLNKPLFVGEVGIGASQAGSSCPVPRRFVACRGRLLAKKFDAALNASRDPAVSDAVGTLAWGYCESAWTRCSPPDLDIVPGDPVLATLARLPMF